MTDVVTKLEVRADGSLAVLDQFEKKMTDAGKATDRSTGSVASFEARMAKARAAMEAGNAIATQTVTRRSAEQRAFDTLAASVDKSYGLRIRLEREAERAAVSAANAVNMGYISQEQALSTLMRLEQRHAAQLSQAATANDNLAASYRSSATAADEAAAAAMRANAARLRSGGGVNQAHTTNLLFQAQDIAMMTAMGQAPMMLAMQQGMQVGGIFHQIGSGKQIVQALGGALVGLLNPLNLVTIGAIGLGAAGVQAFMSMRSETETATEYLEKHKKSLTGIATGYEAASAAVGSYLAAAAMLPREIAAEQLNDQFTKIGDDMEEFRKRAEFIGGVFDGVGSAAERELSTLAGQFANGTITAEKFYLGLDSVREKLNGLEQSLLGWTMKGLIDEMEQGALKAIQFGNAINNLVAQTHALAGLNQDSTLTGFFKENSVEGAIAAMKGLTPELRTQQQILADIYKKALTNPALTGQARDKLGQEYLAATAALAEQKRRQDALAAGKDGTKMLEQWGGNVDQFQQRIASQRMEIELVGKSTYEIERQKAAFDLLNQAKLAGVPITAALTDQINIMSSEYATATVELQRMQEQQRAAEEQMNFYHGTFVGLFSDLKSGLKDGMDFWEALGNAGANGLDKIADRALSMAANGIFDMIFGAVMGGLTGNSLGGGWGIAGGFGKPGIFGIPGMATGGTVAQAGLSWVGERGPELLSLPRGAQVIPNGPSMALASNGNGSNDNAPIIIHNHMQVMPGATEEDGAAFARGVTRELRRQLPDALAAHERNNLRRHG